MQQEIINGLSERRGNLGPSLPRGRRGLWLIPTCHGKGGGRGLGAGRAKGVAKQRKRKDRPALLCSI